MSTRGDGETVNVRRATVADAATISALNADVQAVHAAALPWLFKTPSVDTFPPATAGAMLGRDDVLVYLAYLGDAPSVRPSLRGRGIGGALLGAVRQAAEDRDIRQVALDVWSFNERAEAFFRRHGFAAYNERLWLRCNFRIQAGR